jgi:hypothetical protein
MPEKMQVTAQVPANKKKGTPQLGPVTISVNTGKDLEEMKQLFGAEAIKSNAEANWTVTIQSAIRSALKRGEDPATIQARLADAKMGVAMKGVKVDPVQAYLNKFQSATPEEQKKMLAELQKRAEPAAKAAMNSVK